MRFYFSTGHWHPAWQLFDSIMPTTCHRECTAGHRITCNARLGITSNWEMRLTSHATSGRDSRAEPIPPHVLKGLGQPMLMSMAATSLHLQQKNRENGMHIMHTLSKTWGMTDWNFQPELHQPANHSVTHNHYTFLLITHSLSLPLTHSLTYSFTNSLTHLLARSLTHSLTQYLTHSLTHSLSHSLPQSITHPLA